MTFSDSVLMVLAQMESLLSCLYAVVAATLVVFLPLGILGRRTWVNRKTFTWVCLFFDMTPFDMARLSCSWVRMIVVITFMCSFQSLDLIQYMLFVLCALVHIVLSKGLFSAVTKLLWSLLQLIGLFSASMICGYLALLEAPVHYWFAYGLLCAFMILFSLYLFIIEINTVSLGRSANIGTKANTK